MQQLFCTIHNRKRVPIMPRLMIVPEFGGVLDQGVAELCDFLLIRHMSAVPVEEITVYTDEGSTVFPVDNKTYRTALFLLYCAVLSHSTDYEWKDWLRDYLPFYYGDGLVADARARPDAHPLLHLLQGKATRVALKLRPGYELPDCKSRTAHELITFAWERRGDLTAESPVPLIRYALMNLTQVVSKGEVYIHPIYDPNLWLSFAWLERLRELRHRLDMETIHAADPA